MTTDRVERLRAQLATHAPRDQREARSLQRTRALLDWLHAPFDETADPTHVTASAIVLGDDGRVLLHRHKRLGIWLQPGGHVDPGETCEQAALREVLEETGITGELVDGGPLHVDLHQGPRGHVHLDVRWLVRTAAGVEPAPGTGESPDVEWFAVDRAVALTDIAATTAIHAALDVAGIDLTSGPRGPRPRPPATH